MRYAIITGGVVENIVVADEEYAASQCWVFVPDGMNVEIGDTYENEVFTSAPSQKTRDELKQERQIAVENIKVTTSLGKTFDGDETSQTRMARAIIAMQATNTETVTWVLANNTPTQATIAELVEALALAGAAQAAIWVI